ncbi:hypothetical protein DXO170_14175 [Xanthomonas oryzae pv. oryzae]|uniref:Uncharacterized protein n=1 Tax=Xanthomonas oryzae pv. oryzae TaxID=64187 RepID=A0A854DJR8_XANOO|nr:hypothetical protein ATY42_07355 [Xanthomonas oryzae pv. oryzae]AOS22659.1 hypothetical protein ATY47_07415 [Xanthomonas oryzae pv. oryzae]AOS26826.1 hypothetical protein ATY48_07360 [Xanthomonas oryzae pv. oryzae]AQU44814.1 hypothetical protein ABM06_07320 [Xanthomonas oryzae pv. oryzae]AZK82933.1 hypothetical protein BO992_07570 [Xanthomonas oryzae pv. oryzae]
MHPRQDCIDCRLRLVGKQALFQNSESPTAQPALVTSARRSPRHASRSCKASIVHPPRSAWPPRMECSSQNGVSESMAIEKMETSWVGSSAEGALLR